MSDFVTKARRRERRPWSVRPTALVPAVALFAFGAWCLNALLRPNEGLKAPEVAEGLWISGVITAIGFLGILGSFKRHEHPIRRGGTDD